MRHKTIQTGFFFCAPEKGKVFWLRSDTAAAGRWSRPPVRADLCKWSIVTNFTEMKYIIAVGLSVYSGWFYISFADVKKVLIMFCNPELGSKQMFLVRQKQNVIQELLFLILLNF